MITPKKIQRARRAYLENAEQFACRVSAALTSRLGASVSVSGRTVEGWESGRPIGQLILPILTEIIAGAPRGRVTPLKAGRRPKSLQPQ